MQLRLTRVALDRPWRKSALLSFLAVLMGTRYLLLTPVATSWRFGKHAVIQDPGPCGVAPASHRRVAGYLSSTEPAWSPRAERIAFAVWGDDQTGIYAMSPDGTDVRRVTADEDAVYDRRPQWSPDGRDLVFSRTSSGVPDGSLDGIWRVHVDGTGLRRLAGAAPTGVSVSSPVWSPDGARIAYVRAATKSINTVQKRDTAAAAIWVMDSSGRGARRLAFVRDASALSWSPDGRVIAFEANRLGHTEIDLVDPSTGRWRRLPTQADWAGEPAWSPDGHHLAYLVRDTSRTNVRRNEDEPTYHGRVAIANVDGAGVRVHAGVHDAFTGSAPSWSADGRELVYACGPPEWGPGGPNALHLCTVRSDDGSEPRRLRWSISAARFPAWSPDGNEIAYLAREDGDSAESRLRVVSFRGDDDSLIVAGLERMSPATWSPDGTQLVFVSEPPGASSALCIVDRQTRRVRTLGVQLDIAGVSYELAHDEPVTWSPNGTRLALLATAKGVFDFRSLVVVVAVDGTAQVAASVPLYLVGAPTWSPDGRWLAVAGTPSADFSAVDLYILDSSGRTRPRRLRHGSDFTYGGPAWSPDGSLVAYLGAARRHASLSWFEAEPRHSIVRAVASTGGRSTRIALVDMPLGPLIWSPREQSITLTSTDPAGARSRIVSIDVASHRLRWLTSGAPHDHSPAWSPDGRWLAFVSDRDGTDAVYLVGADGEDERRLAPSLRPARISLEEHWFAGVRNAVRASAERRTLTSAHAACPASVVPWRARPTMVSRAHRLVVHPPIARISSARAMRIWSFAANACASLSATSASAEASAATGTNPRALRSCAIANAARRASSAARATSAPCSARAAARYARSTSTDTRSRASANPISAASSCAIRSRDCDPRFPQSHAVHEPWMLNPTAWRGRKLTPLSIVYVKPTPMSGM